MTYATHWLIMTPHLEDFLCTWDKMKVRNKKSNISAFIANKLSYTHFRYYKSKMLLRQLWNKCYKWTHKFSCNTYPNAHLTRLSLFRIALAIHLWCVLKDGMLLTIGFYISPYIQNECYNFKKFKSVIQQHVSTLKIDNINWIYIIYSLTNQNRHFDHLKRRVSLKTIDTTRINHYQNDQLINDTNSIHKAVP